MQVRVHDWRRSLGWLVRLLLVFFVILFASIWLDLLIEAATYDRLFGSEHACAISTDYCSWGNYMRALMFPSALAVAALIGLAWRRLPGREAFLCTLTIVVALFLASEALETHFQDYRH